MRSTRYFQHTLFLPLIERGGLVLDCGANHGRFARWIVEKTGAIVHGFEPDPQLFSSLPVLPDVTFRPLAVSHQTATLKFNLGEDTKSSLHNLDALYETIEVQGVRLEDYCAENCLGTIELVKVDIEGEEVPVLLHASEEFLRSVKQITVEFHDRFRPQDRPGIKQVLARMEKLGFYVCTISIKDHGDVLFINKRLAPLTAWDRCQLQLQGKYYRGLMRNLRRRMGRSSDLEE